MRLPACWEATAIRAAKAIEPYDISFIEEPVPHENVDAMAHVRRKVNMPVATGERIFTIFGFERLLRHALLYYPGAAP